MSAKFIGNFKIKESSNDAFRAITTLICSIRPNNSCLVKTPLLGESVRITTESKCDFSHTNILKSKPQTCLTPNEIKQIMQAP